MYQRRDRPRGQMLMLPGSHEERRYIHLFCTHTSHVLPGNFHSKLWTCLLPQLALHEPTIQHAIAAVGAAHRNYLNTEEQPAMNPFVLEQYNRSIRCLIEHKDLSPNSQVSCVGQGDLALIACALFVTLEMLQEDHQRALNHIEAGLVILKHRGVVPRRISAESRDIDRELSDLFARLHVELPMFGRGPKYRALPPEKIPLPTTFTDLAHARRVLIDILNQVTVVVQESGSWVRPLYYGKATDDPMWAARVPPAFLALQRGFDAWHSTFDRFLMTKEGQASDKKAALTIRIDYYVSLTWTLAFTKRRETDFDQWVGHFTLIVSLARELLSLDPRSSSDGRTLPFSLEHGVVRALQWTATRCRDPIVRRQAITLLSAHPRKEGFWDWRRSIRISEFVLAWEESQLGSLSVEQRVPPDHCRIYSMAFTDDMIAKTTCMHCINRPSGLQELPHHWAQVLSWS